MMTDTLTPEELAMEGKKAYERGDYIASARSFDAAANAYQSAGDELNAAEMLNNSSVAYLRIGDGEAALKAVEGTPSIFSDSGDLRRQGMSLGNLGAALEAVNRKDDARDVYQQSADILKQAGESQLRASVMQSLSVLQMRSGEQLEALATMQAGLDDLEHPSPKQNIVSKLLKLPSKLTGR